MVDPTAPTPLPARFFRRAFAAGAPRAAWIGFGLVAALVVVGISGAHAQPRPHVAAAPLTANTPSDAPKVDPSVAPAPTASSAPSVAPAPVSSPAVPAPAPSHSTTNSSSAQKPPPAPAAPGAPGGYVPPVPPPLRTPPNPTGYLFAHATCTDGQIAVHVNAEITAPAPVTRAYANVNGNLFPVVHNGGTTSAGEWAGDITIPAASAVSGLGASVLIWDAGGGYYQPYISVPFTCT